MCFQSGDHLFRCLMSSVINKCMALISLRVAGALELVWSCGDGGSMPEFFWRWWSGRGEVAFEQMLSLSAGWGLHDSLLSSKSIKLLLTELSLADGEAYIGQWGPSLGQTNLFFLRWLDQNDEIKLEFKGNFHWIIEMWYCSTVRDDARWRRCMLYKLWATTVYGRDLPRHVGKPHG